MEFTREEIEQNLAIIRELKRLWADVLQGRIKLDGINRLTVLSGVCDLQLMENQ